MRLFRAAISIAVAVAYVMSLPGPAYGSSLTIMSVTHVHQATPIYCVPASTLMQLRSIPGSTLDTQANLYAQGRPEIGCSGEAPGLDPMAWAWLLFSHTPNGYYYDHFKFASAYSGTVSMILQVLNYRDAPGVLVNRGHHAMVFLGASTSCAPAVPSCVPSGMTVYGVYVDDPWYASGNGATPGPASCSGYSPCGRIGLKPPTYIAYSTWVNYYYTFWAYQDCDIWNGFWVAVLRKSMLGESIGASALGEPSNASGRPSYEATSAVKDPRYRPSDRGLPGPSYVEPPAPSSVYAASPAAADLEQALAVANVQQHIDRNFAFRDIIRRVHVDAVVRVTSVDPSFPSYLLASLSGQNGAKGEAMFTLESGGPRFAAITPVAPDRPLYAPSREEADAAVIKAGMKPLSSPDFVWAWSTQSESPFHPFVRMATDQGPVFVDESGTVLRELDPH
jgi:hypothetical protein